jgi:hypothetical protein
MKIITRFLFFYAIFGLLYPDPDCKSASGFRDP